MCQQIRGKATIGVRHQGPGDAVNAGVAGQYAFGQFGQLPVIAFRQVGEDIADLLVDDMKIIQQPFRRRGDGMLPIYCMGDGFIGIQQQLVILAHPQD